MRRLLYIPTIHDEADLGSMGAALTKKSVALSGERRWAGHEEALRAYWESVATYLQRFDPKDVRIYQDGMAVDEFFGRRIVQEAAKRGSKNYRLVLELLNRGAMLRATESPALLLRERENILATLGPQSPVGGSQTLEEHRWQRDQLLAERDRFIAETVTATLREGEIGVLFMGADHNVASFLAADILVAMVKDPRVVAAYVHALLGEQRDTSLEELARYLGSPVVTR